MPHGPTAASSTHPRRQHQRNVLVNRRRRSDRKQANTVTNSRHTRHDHATGGSFSRTLLEHRLVDEYLFWLFPVIAGGGERLHDGIDTTDFDLIDVKQLDNGILGLTYVQPPLTPPSNQVRESSQCPTTTKIDPCQQR